MEEYSYISTHPLDHTRPVTGTLYLYSNDTLDFMKIPLEGAKLFLADGRTDMTKLMLAFRAHKSFFLFIYP